MSITIKPHEILNFLGFNITEDGILVNENDMFLHAESLSLIGKTLSVDLIKDEQLVSLRNGMAGICAANSAPITDDPTKESLINLRMLIAANLKLTYRHNG